MSSDNLEEIKIHLEKEKFLREKLYSVHIYLSKTLFALSSSTLVFSIGFKSYISKAPLKYVELLPIGWFFLILCIILQMFMIRHALQYYYGCYNNHILVNHEHDTATLKSESKIGYFNRISFWSWLIGTCLILEFIYINMAGTN